jgi:hyperosmotically inducible protein
MKTTCPMALTVIAVALLVANGPLRASEMDDQIESSAKSSYVFQTYLKGDEIEIESKDGVVALTGTVSEESHKSLPLETVAGLPGVKSVDNRLEVKRELPTEGSDASLAGKVKAALLFRRNVNASEIAVSVHPARGEAQDR